MGGTTRVTMAQALVMFLARQAVARDGFEQPFFGGVFGIFGHGNVAGVGEALRRCPELPYVMPRNEQAMVHTAAAYAKMSNRLRALICTSSIGPGATNMITAAAGATINRLPVLLLPGDIFANRRPAPVLQQLESAQSQDVSVNDCFRPVSRYWDRIMRPEQLITSLPEAMRVLTSPAETGAVTLALPQDVQTEAFEYPSALFEPRVWTVPRLRADRALLRQAVALLRRSRRPLIVAGGGVIYSDATEVLQRFATAMGIPVAETQAGKGAMPFDHEMALGGVGVTGTSAANRIARDADLVVVIGSRLSDFTTASKTAFSREHVRFVGINVAELDAFKHGALPLVSDAKATLEELAEVLGGHATSPDYRREIAALREAWDREVERIEAPSARPAMSQAEVIGILNGFMQPTDVVVSAAGSLPGDLHKLWRSRDPKTYHLEYGYSCMGYEIAGGLGVKMAAPDREVYVLVGDGSYLMMAQEIATSAQEDVKLTILVLDNQGFASIGGLSEAVGCGGFGTRYRKRRAESGALDGDLMHVDFAANAVSLGAAAITARNGQSLREALAAARESSRTHVIVVPVDRDQRVGGYDSWWDVPVAETSNTDAVKTARAAYEAAVRRARYVL
jgi:3D-(3,5/4)-trihydroxycyclohexane-1,2-dione acylhydrolase (decyclizing)